jgi:CHAD domain-containing protein
MHRWRKRVKDLRYAAETLRRLELEERRAKGHGHGRGAAADRRSGWLAKLATEADDLGEVLGEEHDLAMLAEWLQGADAKALAGSRTRRRLLQQIAARRRKLRRRALKSGSRLYKRSSGDFIERAAKATKRAPRLS